MRLADFAETAPDAQERYNVSSTSAFTTIPATICLRKTVFPKSLAFAIAALNNSLFFE